MNQPLLKIAYARYSRRFRVPVKTARGVAETRDGVWVSLRDSCGNAADSEIAPWEGFNCETLNEAENFLKTLATKTFPHEAFSEILKIADALPCTRHALASAFFLLKNPAAANAPEPQNAQICKLILRDSASAAETLFDQILRSRERGFRSFKIKIGLNPHDEEIRFCQKILQLAATNFPEAQIRFDANGAWKNAEKTFAALAPLCAFPQLEFIEQPLAATPENDAAVYALPPHLAKKIALDESLREPWEMPAGTPVIAVVKPLLVGDFPRLRDWLSQKENAPRFVISSVFETETGRNILRLLCAENADNPRALAAGIDTRNRFL